ncbi:NAD(P)/FAD-dependent oxidoreductase [Aerococcus kribbianus]|uniref:Ferredoxin--NADP reductase n=1 Tax=Aerococcus kribbianus TaxID=2999064 RepID=A0A9X3FVD0_9LACT|nr:MULTISPECIES: NAD(P)/FAD-dependent oxidoreductase [unclassified Aerococcus]MCZ0717641.1 NAD(P)/FAD-dependent oxidoreductase [Aerococcus sp. YH-aer221]MCZ0725929.1 NAD(P)/FAD-dependent oxidoreductase [Aerococcus sp. YH-aer222]
MIPPRTDILIVGGGPAALFAGFYAGMRQLSTRIVESHPTIGGQPEILYPNKNIFDIPAYPKITGHALTINLQEQLARFENSTYFSLNEKVTQLQKQNDGFAVTTQNTTYYAKTVLIAAGNGAFAPRKIKLEGLEEIADKSVDYFLPKPNTLQDKKVVVCGGGDTAFDTALAIADQAKHVYLIHRRNRFRAHEHSVYLAKNHPKIDLLTPYVPQTVQGDKEGNLTQLTLQKARSEQTIDLAVDHLLMAYGYVSSLGPINDWGLKFHDNKIIVHQDMQTNLLGIFAIGDICYYPGKTSLIAQGFSEASIAINGIYQYLNPDQDLHPLHSSEIMH